MINKRIIMINKFKVNYIIYEVKEGKDGMFNEIPVFKEAEVKAQSFYIKDKMVIFHGMDKENAIAVYSRVVSVERI